MEFVRRLFATQFNTSLEGTMLDSAGDFHSRTTPLSSVPFAVSPLIAPIARWSVCDPGSALPDVGFVEPMLRRRLSSLARMVLGVAYECAPDTADVRIVFASRHGELARTTTMLESLAEGEELSPTAFSMSVLNASTGLFSILRKITAATNAISAGPASFGYGLLEACMQHAQNPGQPVLYVYADEPPPAVYGERDFAENGAHAVGLLLARDAETRISWTIEESDASASEGAQSRYFLSCLEQGRAEWTEAGRRWCWARAA